MPGGAHKAAARGCDGPSRHRESQSSSLQSRVSCGKRNQRLLCRSGQPVRSMTRAVLVNQEDFKLFFQTQCQNFSSQHLQGDGTGLTDRCPFRCVEGKRCQFSSCNKETASIIQISTLCHSVLPSACQTPMCTLAAPPDRNTRSATTTTGLTINGLFKLPKDSPADTTITALDAGRLREPRTFAQERERSRTHEWI